MAIAPKAGFTRTLLATVALGAMSFTGTVAIGMPPAIAQQAGAQQTAPVRQGPGSVADLAEGFWMQS